MSSTEIPPSNDREEPKSRPQLSITQIVASALAAITATFAASYFGVSGTVIGAALASVVTVVGNALYSHSIQRTRAQLRAAVPFSLVHPLNAPVAKDAGEDEGPDPTRRVFRWQHAAFAAAGLFLVIAGIVTGVELAAGRPLTSIVHDRSGSGTSLFGGNHPATHTSPKTTPPASSTSSKSTPPPTRPGAPQSTPGSLSPSSTAPTTAPPTPTQTPTGSPSLTPTSPATSSGPVTPSGPATP